MTLYQLFRNTVKHNKKCNVKQYIIYRTLQVVVNIFYCISHVRCEVSLVILVFRNFGCNETFAGLHISSFVFILYLILGLS
jgi:hypothetical protein